jgi:hypothetical protein
MSASVSLPCFGKSLTAIDPESGQAGPRALAWPTKPMTVSVSAAEHRNFDRERFTGTSFWLSSGRSDLLFCVALLVLRSIRDLNALIFDHLNAHSFPHCARFGTLNAHLCPQNPWRWIHGNDLGGKSGHFYAPTETIDDVDCVAYFCDSADTGFTKILVPA